MEYIVKLDLKRRGETMIKEDGTVVFEGAEQDELNRIIGERVARVKSEKPTDYDDLIEIAKDLGEFGFSGTPAEIKAAIKTQKEQIKQQAELDRLQTQADEDGISPSLAKKIKDLEDKLEQKGKDLEEIKNERSAKQKEIDDKKKADEEWDKEVKEFTEKHSDIDLDGLSKNSKFIKFAQKRVGTLTEKYDDFVELIGETEAEAIIKVKSKEERSTSSGNGGSGGEAKLTKDQKTLVDEWNEENPRYKMTYEEYAKKINR